MHIADPNSLGLSSWLELNFLARYLFFFSGMSVIWVYWYASDTQLVCYHLNNSNHRGIKCDEVNDRSRLNLPLLLPSEFIHKSWNLVCDSEFGIWPHDIFCILVDSHLSLFLQRYWGRIECVNSLHKHYLLIEVPWRDMLNTWELRWGHIKDV